jgi:penicillin amidase
VVGLRRTALALIVLIVLVGTSVRHVGPVPRLGGFLDPWNGVWALAATADPAREETLELSGLGAAAETVFDDRGVPHIFAATAEDAARALGYVVARDRLFQMELRWRTASGRMSELVGAGALPMDRRMRRLGLVRSAERDFAALDPGSPAAREIAAYAEGVNAYIDDLDRRHLPLEYRLLGATPARWEPVYSFYLLKLMGWNLTYSRGDLTRLRLQALVGAEAAAALYPVNSPIQQPIQPNGERGLRHDFLPFPPPGAPDTAVGALVQAMGSVLESPGGDPTPGGDELLGSNNWVVAPSRTAAGAALLAGDPHLDLTLPSIWYEAHVVVPGELDVYGVTIPSVPATIIGFNRDVAWSFTNTGADVIDFYEERLDAEERPARYRVDGEWRPLERRVEEYRGHGGALLATDTLYLTHRGPVLGVGGRQLSMRWTVLEPGAETAALRAAARASSVDELLEATASFGAPAQNIVMADRGGNIAIRSTGRFPFHPDGSGLKLRDGTGSASDWTGFWPLDRYPFALNPAQGYLASANQQPLDPRVDETYLGADWPAPWRAVRINQLLAADSSVTPEAMRRYQTDPGNAKADWYLPFFLDAVVRVSEREGVDARAREAAALLARWDRRYTKENVGATLFELAMDELISRTWDELLVTGGEGPPRRIYTPPTHVLASLLHDPQSPWWDDRRSEGAVEDRDAVLVASLAAALDQAKQSHGESDGAGWRWERVQQIHIYHMLGLPSLSSLGIAVQGGPGNVNPSSGGGTHGASWRMVVELGSEVRAWSIYPGGQSGNPASRRYADRIASWAAGELDSVLFPRRAEELDASRVASVLHLIPER